MILDKLEHSSRYTDLHPYFRQAFQYLKELSSPENGRTELAGDLLYAIVSEAGGKKAEESLLEAHRRYIDIHYCLNGTELIGWRALGECRSVETPYDHDKDFMTYKDRPVSWATLTPGAYAIFFPEDTHAPMVSNGSVKKVVIKVAVNVPPPPVS